MANMKVTRIGGKDDRTIIEISGTDIHPISDFLCEQDLCKDGFVQYICDKEGITIEWDNGFLIDPVNVLRLIRLFADYAIPEPNEVEYLVKMR